MISRYFVLFILPLSLFAFLPAQTPSVNSLRGVWKVVQIKLELSGKEYVNAEPQPGMMIFTSEYYSMVWMPQDKKQPDNTTIWQPTDIEKIQQFNSIIVNSGSYTLSDSLLTTFPLVAKTPEFIEGKADYHWSVRQDTLQLIVREIYSRDGVLDEGAQKYPTTLLLVRVE
jgi:hypothetical protein